MRSPNITLDDSIKLCRIASGVNASKRGNEFHIPGVTKVKFYDVKDVHAAIKVIRKFYPENKVQIIQNTAHRFKPGTNGSVAVFLNYNLKSQNLS
jgi:hypothetical protein